MQAMIPFPDVSPEIFEISVFGFNFALRWYALAYIAGILVAWRLVSRAVQRAELWPQKRAPLTLMQVEDFATWAILGVILGGRIGYVLFYKFSYYMQNPSEILMVWQGGMAFHGGFLGVVVAAYIYCRRHDVPKLQMADMLAVAAPVGLLLGRLANFINAELWGRPTELPWGVAFPGQYAQDCGQVFGEICARHPSQLYEALLEGLILGGVLVWMGFRTKAFLRPGLCVGVFLAGYGAARFVVEFVRQPDAQFISPGNPLGLALEISGWGLTMGQLLSLPMIALGLWLVMAAKQHGVEQAVQRGEL
jgi:phosphatidylglycerol:prolipoprotein diacylglycerol transferase